MAPSKDDPVVGFTNPKDESSTKWGFTKLPTFSSPMMEIEFSQNISKTSRFYVLPFFFSMGYFLLHVPFRPVYDRGNYTWTLHTSKIQKVANVFVWIIVMTSCVQLLIYPVEFGVNWQSPSYKKYFQIICIMLITVRLAMFYWLSWTPTEHDRIVDILNQISRGGVLFTSKTTRSWKITGFLYIIFAHLTVISRMIHYLWNIKDMQCELSHDGFIGRVNFGRQVLFMSQLPKDSISSYTYTSGDMAIGVIVVILKQAFLIQYNLTFLFFILPLPLVLWSAANNFEKLFLSITEPEEDDDDFDDDIMASLEKKKEFQPHMQGSIFREYQGLKYLSDNVNSNWAVLSLLWIIETSMRLIFDFKRVIDSGQALHITVLLSGMICFVIALMLCAEVTRKMACFKMALLSEDNEELFDKPDWEIVDREVDKERVGVGSDGLFRVNYGFLAQLLTVVITLFVISFDQDGPPPSALTTVAPNTAG